VTTIQKEYLNLLNKTENFTQFERKVAENDIFMINYKKLNDIKLSLEQEFNLSFNFNNIGNTFTFGVCYVTNNKELDKQIEAISKIVNCLNDGTFTFNITADQDWYISISISFI